MKTEYRYYLEHASGYQKQRRQHLGNVFAVHVPTTKARHDDQVEGAGAIYNLPNSSVAWVLGSRNWIARHCRRIPESEARIIHPKLFVYLDHQPTHTTK